MRLALSRELTFSVVVSLALGLPAFEARALEGVVEPVPETEPETDGEAETGTGAGTGAETAPVTEPETGPEPVPESATVAESGTGSGTGTGTGTETAAVTEPEIGTDTGTVAEPVAEPPAAVAAAPPADGCPRTARAVGPSQAPFLDGQLGVARRACLRDELSVSGDAYLIARPADFYGNIRVGTRLSASYVVQENVSLWGSFELVRYQTLLSAVSNGYLGLGYLSVGSTVVYYREHDRSLAAWTRVVLPTTSGLDRRSQPLALELGTTAEVTVVENFRFHAWLSALGSVGVSDLAPADPRGGLRVGGGVDWVPYEAFSVVLELASGFGHRDGLDFLALQGGFRFAFGDVIGADLSVAWPFAGAEPGLAAAQLSLTARLDGHGPR